MRRRISVPLVLAALAGQACESKMVALGDYTSIIVTTSADFWAEAEQPVTAALERTAFTVRDEKTFTVTHRDPADSVAWDLRLLKQQLVIGIPSDPWVQAALPRRTEFDALPEVVQASNVWARQQAVTVVVLEEPSVEALAGLLPELADMYDDSYRLWVEERMFVSGANTELQESLMQDAGFSLLLPSVYEHSAGDSVHVFRNDNPDPSELIRQIAVTWRNEVPENMRGEDLLAWRAQIVEEHYSYPQVVQVSRTNAGPEPEGFRGKPSYRVQGVWEDPPDDPSPAGGPFILRAVACFGTNRVNNRLYMVDAWLYAPGKEKYAYMIQLEKIMDSFMCAEALP